MRTAAAVLWLVVAARSSAVLAQGLQGAEETAIAADVDTAAAPLAEDAAVCECTDSATWTSPANGGSCRTYKIGGVNEGYCAADDAWAVCPSACDSCPECEEAPLLGVTDYWPVWVPTCLEVTLDESGATEVDVVSLLTTLEQDWLSALDKAYICAYLYPVS